MKSLVNSLLSPSVHTYVHTPKFDNFPLTTTFIGIVRSGQDFIPHPFIVVVIA